MIETPDQQKNFWSQQQCFYRVNLLAEEDSKLKSLLEWLLEQIHVTHREIPDLLLQFVGFHLQHPDVCYRETLLIVTVVIVAVISRSAPLRSSAGEANTGPSVQEGAKSKYLLK